MGVSPSTRVSLLVRIRDGRDGAAWSRFVEVYGPLIYEYGRRQGLQDADAADLTQDVLLAVAGAAGKFAYDPARGSFRSWLFTVARTKRHDLAARLGRQPRGNGHTSAVARLNEVPDLERESPDETEWRRDYEQRLLDWAAEKVRGEFREATWQAFWLTAVERASPQDVASRLATSVGAVYAAKSRVLARLRQQIEQARCDPDHP